MGIIGSDSRSSNFVFVQGDNTAASKGKSDAFVKSNEESGDDKDLNEEAQIEFIKTYAESDDVSQATYDIAEHEGSMEHDPLVESIKDLHIAQEEFETEVQKWRDVGEDCPLIFYDPVHEIIELKDAKIVEVELALSSRGILTEVDDWLMKIIQVDVELVVITATTKRLIEGPLLEIKHNLQHKKVSSRDLQTTEKQDGKLETKENLKKLQNRVCRFTSCFMIQLVLLLVTLYLKFSPQKVEIVPT